MYVCSSPVLKAIAIAKGIVLALPDLADADKEESPWVSINVSIAYLLQFT